jgi:hypothetical protein
MMFVKSSRTFPHFILIGQKTWPLWEVYVLFIAYTNQMSDTGRLLRASGFSYFFYENRLRHKIYKPTCVTYCRLKWEKYWYTCTFVYMLKLGYNDLILTLRNRSCHIFWQNCDITLSRFANLIKQIYYINILLGIVCKYKPTSLITSNIICKNIFYSQMYNLNLLQWALMLDVMETIVETI